MKLAIVFDDLIQYGGAEKLLLAVLEVWPNADLYSVSISKSWEAKLKNLEINYFTSYLQRFPLREKLNKLYAVVGLHSHAYETFRFESYDVVLSISARFSHLVNTRPETIHIAYMNSPGRMYWEPGSYFENEPSIWKKLVLPALHFFRQRDYFSSQKADYLIANSNTPKKRIKKYYGREADVIYPFYEDLTFENPFVRDSNDEYYCVVTRLVPWKKVETAIRAFNELGIKLKVVGEGPDIARLRQMAKPNIEFMGYVTEQEKAEILAGSKAVIITQFEDFGIVPLEAMSLGTPVLAYGRGGVLETVLDGETGCFYYEQTPEAIMEAVKNFDSTVYSKEACAKRAQVFKKEKFQAELKEYIDSVYLRRAV